MAKTMEVTPQELAWCKLRAQGYSQADAYEQAFPDDSRTRESTVQAASRLAKRPRVVSTLKDLFASAKKSVLLSHGEFLARVLDDWNAARQASNWTAASQFARLAGQAIGSLTDNINLTDDRPSADQLIDRLGNSDPELSALLRKRLSARDDFDA